MFRAAAHLHYAVRRKGSSGILKRVVCSTRLLNQTGSTNCLLLGSDLLLLAVDRLPLWQQEDDGRRGTAVLRGLTGSCPALSVQGFLNPQPPAPHPTCRLTHPKNNKKKKKHSNYVPGLQKCGPQLSPNGGETTDLPNCFDRLYTRATLKCPGSCCSH